MKFKNNLLMSVISAGSLVIGCVTAGQAEDGMVLKGRVTSGPARSYGYGFPGGTVLVPSPAGPALVRPSGELVGTINMQEGLPLGALVMPSAMGPVVIGPRGEIRGMAEQFKTGKSTPLIGVGPVVNYSAVDALAAMRAMFTTGGSYPLPAPVAVMPLGTYQRNGQQVAMPATGPQTRAFARVIRRGLDPSTEENRLLASPRNPLVTGPIR